jgi:peptide deformylase
VEIITVESSKRGVLRRRAKPVGRITKPVHELIDGMIEAMHGAAGVGLAAPQVGVSKRVIVAEVGEQLHVLVDPKIVTAQGEDVASEGCISIPGVVADVPRAARVVVKGKNRKGRGITINAEGLLARVLQHEVDHLDGILFLDRVVDKSTIRTVAESSEVQAVASG